jgi:hypothetical protein
MLLFSNHVIDASGAQFYSISMPKTVSTPPPTALSAGQQLPHAGLYEYAAHMHGGGLRLGAQKALPPPFAT